MVKNLNELADKLASETHEKWREPRKKEDGTFEPRIKKTSDETWIKEHGTNQVDIANTAYEQLPKDWQKENKESAYSAMKIVLDAVMNKIELDKDFIEEASSKIHDEWVYRHKNEAWAKDAGLLNPYEDLPEKEKKKDRDFVITAIKIYNKNIK